MSAPTALPLTPPSVNGIECFWNACIFSEQVRQAGYKLHRITLEKLTKEALDALAGTIERHYLEPRATFRNASGGDSLARVLEARLPSRADNRTAKKDRGGDIGELLGIEWLRRHSNGSWECCYTLRWKESVRPRRGEDIIGVDWSAKPIGLLKGEAKAGKTISSTTVSQARERLNQDQGWPSPFTIDFLAEKLEFEGRLAEAERLFEERFQTQPGLRDTGCTHLLFLFSAADPSDSIPTHAAAPKGTIHGQIAAVLVCPDYEAIRDNIHKRAIDLAQGRNLS